MAVLSRREFVKAAVAGAAVLAGARWCRADTSKRRPNFVIILVDDVGYGDLGCYGGKDIRTPKLDRMAAEGLRLTDFHSNAPICSPTRAALLTGRYQQRMGIDRIITHAPISPKGLPVSEVTFAQMLKQAGYVTGLSGKWHLGFDREYRPLHRGFDEFHGFLSGQIDYHSHVTPGGEPDWWAGDALTPEEGYSTDLITAHAVDFIRRHRNEAFCLYVAHAAGHSPYQGPNDKAEAAVGKPGTEFGPRKDQAVAYREMIESLDAGVGRVLQTLKDLKLDDNTLVFFTSDNGQGGVGSPGPCQGRKGMLLEGGIRVPGIAWWPGRTKPGQSAQTTMTMDLLPTMAALAGAEVPKGVTIDGANLSGLLLEGKPLPERTLFWQHRGGQWAMRKGKWKIWNLRSPWLFDLDADLGEKHNVAAANEKLVKSMVAEYRAWRQRVTPPATQGA
jgi:arylsulfatase A-like enzyme